MALDLIIMIVETRVKYRNTNKFQKENYLQSRILYKPTQSSLRAEW